MCAIEGITLYTVCLTWSKCAWDTDLVCEYTCLQVSVSWTSYSSARLLGHSYIHMFISKLCKDVAMVHIQEGFSLAH